MQNVKTLKLWNKSVWSDTYRHIVQKTYIVVSPKTNKKVEGCCTKDNQTAKILTIQFQDLNNTIF